MSRVRRKGRDTTCIKSSWRAEAKPTNLTKPRGLGMLVPHKRKLLLRNMQEMRIQRMKAMKKVMVKMTKRLISLTMPQMRIWKVVSSL